MLVHLSFTESSTTSITLDNKIITVGLTQSDGIYENFPKT